MNCTHNLELIRRLPPIRRSYCSRTPPPYCPPPPTAMLFHVANCKLPTSDKLALMVACDNLQSYQPRKLASGSPVSMIFAANSDVFLYVPHFSCRYLPYFSRRCFHVFIPVLTLGLPCLTHGLTPTTGCNPVPTLKECNGFSTNPTFFRCLNRGSTTASPASTSTGRT